MNLLMVAPLLDSRGNLRYYIGAQVDITGLVKDCTDLDALQRMLNKQESEATNSADTNEPEEPKDEFQELSEMFNMAELDTVRKHGGRMHREQVDDDDESIMNYWPRLLLKDPSMGDADRPLILNAKPDNRLSGVYKNVRPNRSLCSLLSPA